MMKRPLELTHVLGVDPEVRLQRMSMLTPGGTMHERATRPLALFSAENLLSSAGMMVGVLAHDVVLAEPGCP